MKVKATSVFSNRCRQLEGFFIHVQTARVARDSPALLSLNRKIFSLSLRNKVVFSMRPL